MRILIINKGSSSFKSAVYQLSALPEKPLAPVWENKHCTFEDLEKLKNIDIIGHRIVHGGNEYRKSILINADVKKKIRELAELAPLHNKEDLESIEECEKIFKDTPQVAVFDTAYHKTMPKASVVYPGPFSWYEEGIQRFGFHGINFQYCARRVKQILNKDLKTVICHLGSGASLCAVKEGKSIDTTMGFTPLEGLMMETRSGSIDPGIILHLLKKKSRGDIAEQLYHQSGLLGISEISGDMREIIKNRAEGHERCTLAFDIYLHILCKNIAAMMASLNGAEVLVFTGGVGENTPVLRKRVSENLSFTGIELNGKQNETSTPEDREISLPNSKIRLLVIPANEGFEIARECWLVNS